MDDPLLHEVHTFLHKHSLDHPQALLVVAVSGGPDSLALLHLLRRLQTNGGPRLHVAHLDHGFRGAQSAAEADFVADTARAWGLPTTISYADIPTRARQERSNPQATARRVRYAFLADVALATNASAVAVAHHADDQAETLMLHLLRGAGSSGLRGMRPVVPWNEWAEGAAAEPSASGVPLIRPLLAVTRASIEAYCAAQQLQPRNDPSNRSCSYTRNRIRAELLPVMASFNPQISTSLSRTATLIADDEEWIADYLDQLWPDLVRLHTHAIELDRQRMLALHPALQRRVLRRAVQQLDSQAEVGYAPLEQARTVIAAGAGRQVPLGAHLQLIVESERVLLTAPNARLQLDVPQLAVAELALPTVGRVELDDGWAVLIQPDPPEIATNWWVSLDREVLPRSLLLRRRRPGDRFRPAGGRGSRRLQDFFVDRKIARSLRDAWPLLATEQALIWVCGLRADARFVATAASRQIIWVGFIKRV